MKLEIIQKLLQLKCSSLNYKNIQLLFLWQCFFNIFMRQTLDDDFGGLHKDMNYAFPLSFDELLVKGKSLSINQRNLQFLATEILQGEE